MAGHRLLCFLLKRGAALYLEHGAAYSCRAGRCVFLLKPADCASLAPGIVSLAEVDGGQHQARAAADRERTRWLESQGYRVMRFWNNQVLVEPAAVQEVILNALEQ